MGDSIAANINNTSLKDTIINLVRDNSPKKLEISLNEIIGVQSKMFFGSTVTASSPITIVNILPELTGDPVMLGGFLKVNALANLNGSSTAINWTVAVESDNIDPALTCTLTKVTIFYFCDNDIQSSSIQDYTIAGR
jgi:hypothetical protein